MKPPKPTYTLAQKRYRRIRGYAMWLAFPMFLMVCLLEAGTDSKLRPMPIQTYRLLYHAPVFVWLAYVQSNVVFAILWAILSRRKWQIRFGISIAILAATLIPAACIWQYYLVDAIVPSHASSLFTFVQFLIVTPVVAAAFIVAVNEYVRWRAIAIKAGTDYQYSLTDLLLFMGLAPLALVVVWNYSAAIFAGFQGSSPDELYPFRLWVGRLLIVPTFWIARTSQVRKWPFIGLSFVYGLLSQVFLYEFKLEGWSYTIWTVILSVVYMVCHLNNLSWLPYALPRKFSLPWLFDHPLITDVQKAAKGKVTALQAFAMKIYNHPWVQAIIPYLYKPGPSHAELQKSEALAKKRKELLNSKAP